VDCLAEFNRRTGFDPAGTGPSRINGLAHIHQTLRRGGASCPAPFAPRDGAAEAPVGANGDYGARP
jgi:hypothetical protein